MFRSYCSSNSAHWDLDWPIEETSHPGEERVLQAPALVVVIVVRVIVVAVLVARVVRVPRHVLVPPLTWAHSRHHSRQQSGALSLVKIHPDTVLWLDEIIMLLMLRLLTKAIKTELKCALHYPPSLLSSSIYSLSLRVAFSPKTIVDALKILLRQGCRSSHQTFLYSNLKNIFFDFIR